MIFLYYLHHLMESTTIGLDLVFEHRMAVPSLYLCLLLSWLIVEGFSSFAATRSKWQQCSAVTVLAVSVCLALSTYQRVRAWGSPLAFTEDMYLKAPNKGRVAYALGRQYYLENRWEESEHLLKRALELEPGDWKIPNALAVLYAKSGRCSEALPIIENLLSYGLEHASNRQALGIWNQKNGQREEALNDYQRSIEFFPNIGFSRFYMAQIYLELGEHENARTHAMQELSIYPESNEPQALLRKLDELEGR
jgi:tetratricopeptide (TPR) repeat protein